MRDNTCTDGTIVHAWGAKDTCTNCGITIREFDAIPQATPEEMAQREEDAAGMRSAARRVRTSELADLRNEGRRLRSRR